MSGFWEPFEFAFFRNGLAVATLAGALCGLVGVYVTLRNMSYIGHGLSHAIFGGAAASALIGFNFFIGAGIWGLASGLAIGRVARRRGVAADAAIGIVTTASFAFGIALLGLFGQVRRALDAALFGSILGVTTADVAVVAGVTVLAAGVVFFGYRPLLFTTFDPEVAQASGVRTGVADAVLMAILSLSILATMKVLGVVLVAAALIIPPVTARLLTTSFARLLFLSVAIGSVSAAVGMILSYHVNVSSGATIVLVSALVFTVVYGLTARGRHSLHLP
ncbi:MAG: metal ABC transporter permease [Actinobacteria bacterium]|nr:metal ABC transporter permease [Actinomycetota bacterium]